MRSLKGTVPPWMCLLTKAEIGKSSAKNKLHD